MKNRRCFIAALCCLVSIFNTSCGLIHPPDRHNGYLANHFYSCGPTAISKALNLYAEKNNVKFKKSYTAKQISIEVQDSTVLFDLREFLTLIDKRSAEITWPQEIKHNLKLKGIAVKEVKSLNDLNKTSDIAIVLVHWKGKLTWYHWVVFPKDNIYHYGKDKTVVDRIFLLEPLKR